MIYFTIASSSPHLLPLQQGKPARHQKTHLSHAKCSTNANDVILIRSRTHSRRLNLMASYHTPVSHTPCHSGSGHHGGASAHIPYLSPAGHCNDSQHKNQNYKNANQSTEEHKFGRLHTNTDIIEVEKCPVTSRHCRGRGGALRVVVLVSE
ncbi:hypothetical protein E2C01_036711 [Portunus trituberculatus]|uniref:Uncharacterized protein n=1 Tax=Portunus trituberculatus TaxID=210409 RepID=A0A5B7FF22_PORTR|nr:hypothetical protein [Portunus trituberculatus]